MDQFSELIEFLKTYGAPVVLLWAMIETDLVFLVVGALAHAGYLNPYSCFPAALMGALTHDIVVFWLAKNRADWVRKRKAYQKLSAAGESFAQKLGLWQLAICRPLYGTRYPTIIFWGLRSISYPKFISFILVGLLPWAALLSSIGFRLWKHIDDFDDWLAEAKNWIFGSVVLAVLIILLRKWLRNRRAENQTLHPSPESVQTTHTQPLSQETPKQTEKVL